MSGKRTAFWAVLLLAPFVIFTAWTMLPENALMGLPWIARWALLAGTALCPGLILIVRRRRNVIAKVVFAALYSVICVLLTPVAVIWIGCNLWGCDL